MFRLSFYGGAGTVTGSNFLVENGKGRVLVDCGIEQGRDFSERRMYEPFPYDVSSIDALVITHAHLDHIGRGPKLMREGFKGTVYMTLATRDLTELMLRDSVSLVAKEAERHGLPPLYREEDVAAFLACVEPLPYHREREVALGIRVLLRNSGHILGSASVTLKDEDGTTLAITSDIGNSPSPYLPDVEPITDADAVVIESVYGDRLHPHLDDRVPQFRDTLNAAIARGGTILMPAFSIERTQLMLYELSNLMEAGEVPQIPVFLDSPLAIGVTEVYEKHAQEYFNTQAKEELAHEQSLFRFPFLTMTRSRDESRDIDKESGVKLIIAGAGMSHGGRIGKHEAKYLPDPSTTLLIVGYQAPGSPGRLLQDGAPEVRIDGRMVKVRAKVETLTAWSAHADRDGLLAFAEKALPKAHTIFVALGEPSSARFLAQRIHDYLGGRAIAPSLGETWRIDKNGATKEKGPF
ncbi:MAG TPA: MBL fold metallo-hydrolase [Candidatus Paceibacterota bacterium]|nr:MBL fold metallo-hydrolase [Candidatus Paceibacterota bacterium]